MGGAVVPVLTSVFSAAASSMVSGALNKSVEAPTSAVSAEDMKAKPAANQPVEGEVGVKENDILAEQKKRQKQGFLESFGDTGLL